MADSSTTGFFDGAYDAEQLPDPLPECPFQMFQDWLREAAEAGTVPNPNAMCLSTVSPDGQPSSRMVLCKEVLGAEGAVVFYTNRKSKKARDLEGNPKCSLLFHWDHQGRQARFEGFVTRAPDAMSDAYFASRRWESRLGAHASDQSEPIESRAALIEKVMAKAIELDLDLSKIVDGGGRDLEIPRPSHWGGYLVRTTSVELWCDGAGRVHERARWDRAMNPIGDSFEAGPWSVSRLQP